MYIYDAISLNFLVGRGFFLSPALGNEAELTDQKVQSHGWVRTEEKGKETFSIIVANDGSSSSANLHVMLAATVDNGCLKIPLQEVSSPKEGAFSSPTVEKSRFSGHELVKSILCRPTEDPDSPGRKSASSGGLEPEAYLQVIVDASLSDDLSKLIAKGTCVVVDGCLKLPPQGTKQKIELKVEEVVSVGTVDQVTYPFPKNKPSLEHLRKYLHIRARTNLIASVARIRNVLAFATHSFFQSQSFLYVSTPIITTSDCEGAGGQGSNLADLKKDGETDYSQDFFGRQAFLSVSGQLQLESYACALGSEDTDCAEAYVRYMCTWLLDNCYDDLEVMAKNVDEGCIDRLKLVASTWFVRVTYTEAIDLLKKAVAQRQTFENQVEWGIHLASGHERYLTEVVFQKLVIVYNYPKGIKAFYMRVNDGRCHGCPRSKGDGFTSRTIRVIPGLETSWNRMDKIRDVIPFPRYPGRADL
ncbi:unnamed protein product [Brassica napus]|uniref:(rape) hypothetical protein n=1 Tax=Brassica napus TaxID=3708 RepID=A0A817BFU1_BRANA|nr:unnamed protein product [Brassica napus]